MSQTATQTSVSIVILTHNEWDYTKLCLESIRKCTPEPHEVIIVDNGSLDGTPANVWEFGVDKLLMNAENIGFGKGCNQGIEAAQGSHVLFLNNDVVVFDGWLDRLLWHLDSDPELGAIGPLTNYAAGRQGASQVPYSDLVGAELYAAQKAGQQPQERVEAWRLIGFCMLVRIDAISKIGGFDDRFGAGNFEDDDLCHRLRLAGFNMAIALDVFVHHFGSRTFEGAKIDYRETFDANWDFFKKKWRLPGDLVMSESPEVKTAIMESSNTDEILVDMSGTIEPGRTMQIPEDMNSLEFSQVLKNSDRSAPCFCGSGTKFKKCHGKLPCIKP